VTRVLPFAPPLALMGLIFFLSAQPDLSTGLGFWDLVLRKLAHIAAFGALTLLWWRALPGPRRRAGLLAAAISLLYAVGDEYHQSFVEGRTGSPVDVGIDAIGIGIAYRLGRRGRLPFARRRAGQPSRESIKEERWTRS
jgi:VanZ like family